MFFWFLDCLIWTCLTASVLGCDHDLMGRYKCMWLSNGSVFLIKDFISKREVRNLREIAEFLFSSKGGAGWEQRAVNDVFAAVARPIPALSELEASIANVSGIPPDKADTPLYFTQHLPGALRPGTYVHGIHHDKNAGEKRTMTILVYLSSAKSLAHGGHTIFPQLPRYESKAGRSATVSAERGIDDKNPLAYLRHTFERAFMQGKRELLPHDIAESPQDAWDARAVDLVEKECELALRGRNNVLAVRPKAGSAVVFHNVHPVGGLVVGHQPETNERSNREL
eukprot:TRINITY_DN22870_c0_g1_i2.p1 TRINITY_DN22870_c0_g1~~TRINITY_DN22870_c0_g1_i2.p1  ORF type:complete len:282 (+),score=30.58 TRINITY_DN22870_c0_g1_i2:66-911(+)